jgi:hypothetical protein
MAHRNARTTLYARSLIVQRHAAGTRPAIIAEQLGISRATVYTWLHRHSAEGPAGLQDRSSRPHTSPNRVSDEAGPAASRTGVPGRRTRAGRLDRRADPGPPSRARARGDRPDHRSTDPPPTQRDPLRTPGARGSAAPGVDLVRRVGRGASSVARQALQQSTGRSIALKLLDADYSDPLRCAGSTASAPPWRRRPGTRTCSPSTTRACTADVRGSRWSTAAADHSPSTSWRTARSMPPRPWPSS